MARTARGPARDRLVSSVAAEWAGTGDPASSALVLGDASEVLAGALEARGTRVRRWHRLLVPGLEPGGPWPPAGSFDQVWLRIPRSGLEIRMLLTAAGARTARPGTVLCYGAKDEGIRSLDNHRPPGLEPFRTVLIKRRCRVCVTSAGRDGPGPAPGDGLDAWATTWSLDWGAGPRDWVSYPGVFAHGRLDPATRLLIHHLPPLPSGARVLDVGAGTGVIGAAIVDRVPGARVDLLDPDAIALAAAAINVPGARTIRSAGIGDVRGTYDLIASNPPVHEGKSETLVVVSDLIRRSPRLLAPEGALALVIQRRLPVEALLREALPAVDVIADEGPFRVWLARRVRTR